MRVTRRALFFGAAAAVPSLITTKTYGSEYSELSRGVGAWWSPTIDANLADCRAHWYYTWSPSHDWIRTPSGCEFVPMIWGREFLDGSSLEQARSNGSYLLGFNEPDRPDQSNMSVGEALDAWPALEWTGLPLGAPAVARSASTPGSWLDQFMTGTRERGYRVDFIPVHWYPSLPLLEEGSVPAMVSDLISALASVHSRYGLPVWLTEFSLIAWTNAGGVAANGRTQSQFLSSAARAMASLPYLERWAWFSLPPFANLPSASLYIEGGRTTPAGRTFRSLP